MSVFAMLFRGVRLVAATRWPVEAVLVALTCWLLAGAASAASLEDVESCLASNVPKKSSAVAIKLRSRHRGGFESEHEGRIYWERSAGGRAETLICLEQPPAVRGLAYLVVEEDTGVAVWGYLPEKHRVLQIHASVAARRARIARTAISYDDLRYLPFNLTGAEPEEISDSVVAERKVSVIRLSLPPGENPPYARVISFIDQESCLPLRTEFYETAHKLLKILTVDPGEIRRTGGIRLAHSMTIEDLRNEVITELQVEQVQIDLDLPDRMFVPARLDRNQCRSPKRPDRDAADN
jgi:hypothetical protein